MKQSRLLASFATYYETDVFSGLSRRGEGDVVSPFFQDPPTLMGGTSLPDLTLADNVSRLPLHMVLDLGTDLYSDHRIKVYGRYTMRHYIFGLGKSMFLTQCFS